MPMSTTCLLEPAELTDEQVLAIRETGSKELRELLARLVCIECGKPVRAHRNGPSVAAHFEHLERNPNCKLSDPHR